MNEININLGLFHGNQSSLTKRLQIIVGSSPCLQIYNTDPIDAKMYTTLQKTSSCPAHCKKHDYVGRIYTIN